MAPQAVAPSAPLLVHVGALASGRAILGLAGLTVLGIVVSHLPVNVCLHATLAQDIILASLAISGVCVVDVGSGRSEPLCALCGAALCSNIEERASSQGPTLGVSVHTRCVSLYRWDSYVLLQL